MLTIEELKEAVETYVDFLIFFNSTAFKLGIRADNDITGEDFQVLERDTMWLNLS